MNRTLIAALALALAACGSTSTQPGMGLQAPSSVAVFDGVTSKNAGVHPYVAVANSGNDEIVLIDAVDDKPVMAPIIVRALSIPTVEPHPAMVVSADLADDVVVGGTVTQKTPDLLVAVSSAATSLELVQTWPDAAGEASPHVVSEVALEAPVLAVTAMPVPTPDGSAAVSGKARVVAALAGARLAVVEYDRQPDGSIAAAGAPGAQVTYQDLTLSPGTPGFDALSLAWDPADLAHLYAASADPIPVSGSATGVEGVAQLDVTQAPGAWTWRAIDARAPTRLVAAWTLRERQLSGASATDATIAAFQATPVHRVYAYLDPTRCGPYDRVPCGIAVLDPGTLAMVPDPSGRMPYLSPIPVPGIATALVVSGPPHVQPANDPDYQDPAAMKVLYGVSARVTTAVMAVPSTTGAVYFADLGRWAIPSSQNPLTDFGRTAATSAIITTATIPDPANAKLSVTQSLGVWSSTGVESARLRTDSAGIVGAVQVTPGYTPTETWTVGFETPLPGLELRPAETGPTGDGGTWVAMQVTVPSGGTCTTPPCEHATQVARVYDPELGVAAGAAGDLVLLSTAGKSASVGGQTIACPDQVEGRAGAFIPPDARRPGGALVLTPPTCAAGDAACTAQAACITQVLNAPSAATGQAFDGQRGLVSTVRATDTYDTTHAALLVTGANIGYAGRAPVTPNSQASGYALAYPQPPVTEDTLAAACPLAPWPFLEDGTPTANAPAGALGCTTASCRASCESLVLARKARRLYQLSEACGVADATCMTNWPPAQYPFPLADGPLIAFRASVGIARLVNGALQVEYSADAPFTQGLTLTIQTRSGVSLSSRSPTNLGAAPALPRGGTAFDRSPYGAGGDYRFLVPYVDGSVLDFSPAQSASSPAVLR